jgi:hypothetical protein
MVLRSVIALTPRFSGVGANPSLYLTASAVSMPRETAEAVPMLELALITPLKRGVNEGQHPQRRTCLRRNEIGVMIGNQRKAKSVPCWSALKKQMQSLQFPKKLKIPLWSWFGQIWFLCLGVFFFGFLIWLILDEKKPRGFLFIAIAVWMFVSGMKTLRQMIALNGAVMLEDGLQIKKRERTVSYRWEDVTKYVQYQGAFGLVFKDGERIRFDAGMETFKEIRLHIVERLAKIDSDLAAKRRASSSQSS